MDIMSIIGWLLGFALMWFGMVFQKETVDGVVVGYKFFFDNVGSFFDPTSIAIVIGGCFAALMISFPAKCFVKIPKHLKIVIMPTKYDPRKYIAELVEFAKEARVSGLLALEDKLHNTKDEFMRTSLMLVVDSVDPEKVKQLLETELDYLDDRHAQDRAFYDKGSSYAPAFGMIGTLIGLILLLKDLSDPSKLGPAMAVALVTTFYGTVLSNLIFTPISNKLKVRHEEEYLCKLIIAEGVQAIQAGENPRFIEEKLTQLLPRGKAGKNGKSADSESESAAAEK
ncbi:MAG: motility protein A [Provencibacterium sp.]|jgi:chemotaxis protein MotA|nr:motility protein A [Provencibacterium sp.]